MVKMVKMELKWSENGAKMLFYISREHPQVKRVFFFCFYKFLPVNFLVAQKDAAVTKTQVRPHHTLAWLKVYRGGGVPIMNLLLIFLTFLENQKFQILWYISP